MKPEKIASIERYLNTGVTPTVKETFALLDHIKRMQEALEKIKETERDLISFYDNTKVIGYRNPESLRRWLENKMRPAFEAVRATSAAPDQQ